MIGPHTPSACGGLGVEHAAQPPVQAALQQTPSTQNRARALAGAGAGGALRLNVTHAVPRAVVAGRAVARWWRRPSCRRRAANVRVARVGGDRLADARAVAGAGRRVRRAEARFADARRAGLPLAAGAGAVARAVLAAAGRRVLRAFAVRIGARGDRDGRGRRSAPVFAFAQALQAPPQAVSQHTPSTQKPVAHSALLAHVAPCVLSGMHAVPAQ